MDRIKNVDMGRFVAVVAIIMLHTQPFRLSSPEENDLYRILNIFITNLSRFAVPFFFVISGYFWGIRIREGQDPISFSIRKVGRIFLIFFAWTIVYLIPYSRLGWGMSFLDGIALVQENINILSHQPIVDLLMRGSKLHLWYLVALMSSMFISALFLSRKQGVSLLLLAVVLYIVGVLAKSYEDTPIGMNIGFNTLYGPFFGTLLFVSGYFLSELKITEKWFIYGLGIFVFGTITHFSEIFILWRVFDNLPQHDYMFGTYFMGMGFSIITLSGKPSMQNNIFSELGRLSLGIYAVHFVFVDLFSEFGQIQNSFFGEIGYPLIVLVPSVVIVYLLSINKFTRMFVV